MKRIGLGLVLGLLFLAGCGDRGGKGIFMAAGSYGDLAVVYSTEDLAPVARRFADEVNEKILFVIQAENRFSIDLYPASKWKLAKGYKNAIFLVDLQQSGPVAKETQKLISGSGWEKLHQGGGGLVQRKDPWSSYQLLVVAAAPGRNSLASLLHRYTGKIRETLERDSLDRIQRRNRYHGLANGLMNACWDTYGFYLEIPQEYQRTQQGHAGNQGLELMQKGPSRGITITWQDCPDPDKMLADRAYLLAMRTKMAHDFHHEELVTETLVWHEDGLPGVGGIKLSGAWSGTDFAGGGPFWSYFLAVPEQKRIYCVDLLAYAPGMDKMMFFRQMEAIASTFKTTRPQP